MKRIVLLVVSLLFITTGFALAQGRGGMGSSRSSDGAPQSPQVRQFESPGGGPAASQRVAPTRPMVSSGAPRSQEPAVQPPQSRQFESPGGGPTASQRVMPTRPTVSSGTSRSPEPAVQPPQSRPFESPGSRGAVTPSQRTAPTRSEVIVRGSGTPSPSPIGIRPTPPPRQVERVDPQGRVVRLDHHVNVQMKPSGARPTPTPAPAPPRADRPSPARPPRPGYSPHPHSRHGYAPYYGPHYHPRPLKSYQGIWYFDRGIAGYYRYPGASYRRAFPHHYSTSVVYRSYRCVPFVHHHYRAFPWYGTFYYPVYYGWSWAAAYAPGFAHGFVVDLAHGDGYMLRFSYGYGSGIRWGSEQWMYTWYPYGGYQRIDISPIHERRYGEYRAPVYF